LVKGGIPKIWGETLLLLLLGRDIDSYGPNPARSFAPLSISPPLRRRRGPGPPQLPHTAHGPRQGLAPPHLPPHLSSEVRCSLPCILTTRRGPGIPQQLSLSRSREVVLRCFLEMMAGARTRSLRGAMSRLLEMMVDASPHLIGMHR
jgi:hypothetical protein